MLTLKANRSVNCSLRGGVYLQKARPTFYWPLNKEALDEEVE